MSEAGGRAADGTVCVSEAGGGAADGTVCVSEAGGGGVVQYPHSEFGV